MDHLVGKGLYSIPEAASLIRYNPIATRRMVLGYKSANKIFHSAINIELVPIKEEIVLSFVNLIELMLIARLREQRLSLQYIKKAASILESRFGIKHPFAWSNISTDGYRIFAEMDERGEKSLVEIGGKNPGHVVFKNVVEQYLKDIDFSAETALANRWYPLGKKKRILLNPSVAFGHPIIEDTRIMTRTIVDLSEAGETEKNIANWYELKISDIHSAIYFERKYLKKAS